MPGLDTTIVEHRLPLIPNAVPIQQQLRRIKLEVALKIKEEMEKQWNAGFLAVVEYPQWVANIVPVPKKDGKVRMCIDYRDLNRASPKDNFPLPHIDMLVDNIAHHTFYSFMDDFYRFNQIWMAEEDKEQTTFITTWGTFCYKVMPFRLKNVRATYQRAMVTLFHDMMHKEVEVYVDDMIPKLWLNPTKCTFRVKTEKLLGFIVNHRGIELDPNKVKAIWNMPPPKLKLNPVYLLANNHLQPNIQTPPEEPEDGVKHYLETPPILVSAVPKKPLILYLTMLEESIGGILGQRDASRKEQAIYYLNKKFTKCKQRYSTLERTCCALVWAAKRLRQYMLAHTTWLIAKMDPLKYIFEKPALTGRIACWQMVVSEYDIVYTNQKAIKGRALAEQLAHHPLNEYHPLSYEFSDEQIMSMEDVGLEIDSDEWKLWFDGASNMLGNGIGAVLASLEG
ncbi:Retrovirus-related Pol polyprotein from transposon opus, partial [Mucuna pruriens]